MNNALKLREKEKSSTHPRIKRELKTVEVMIGLYCQDHHSDDTSLCSECKELLNYARMRLNRCPFQENKTTCGNCAIHCYKPKFREMIRKVMKYSGPKMIFHRPTLAIGHMFDSLRKKPTGVKTHNKKGKK